MIQHIRSRVVTFRLIAFFITAVVIYVLYVVYVSYREIGSSYAAFLYAEERHMTAAVIPSIEQNPIRQELNQVLAEALSDGMSSSDRLIRARRGVELLKDTEKQIDSTMKARDELIATINDVRSLDGIVAGLLHAYDIPRVTALAEKQMLIVDDIRGLSYRANFHTTQIFKQIIEDRGTLTSAHVVALNDLIPKVEEQFDQRSNLYAELESLHNKVHE